MLFGGEGGCVPQSRAASHELTTGFFGPGARTRGSRTLDRSDPGIRAMFLHPENHPTRRRARKPSPLRRCLRLWRRVRSPNGVNWGRPNARLSSIARHSIASDGFRIPDASAKWRIFHKRASHVTIPSTKAIQPLKTTLQRDAAKIIILNQCVTRVPCFWAL